MTKEINNISILIGNGFDIQVLNHLNVPTNTSYYSFYNFINWKYSNEVRKNLIVQKMKSDKELGEGNWSDFENTIKNIIKSEYENKEEIFSNTQYITSLTELQTYFSDFLNTIVTTDVLTQVDKLGEIMESPKFGARTSLPLYTLQFFLGDLSCEELKRMKFVENAHHHNTINFAFFNFNYTPLFDNYIMLDKNNFDPHMYKQSSNNFHLQLFKDEGVKEECYTELSSRLFHPHGFQHTPRSMLFGFDNPNQVIKGYKGDLYTNSEVQEYVKYFLKPYWAENDKKYKHFLNETELFIIFGLSIGESDKYWWKNIADGLVTGKAELIIYNYSNNDTEEEKNRVAMNFLSVSGVISDNDICNALRRIFVVNFNQSKTRYAFNVDKNNIPRDEI